MTPERGHFERGRRVPDGPFEDATWIALRGHVDADGRVWGGCIIPIPPPKS